MFQVMSHAQNITFIYYYNPIIVLKNENPIICTTNAVSIIYFMNNIINAFNILCESVVINIEAYTIILSNIKLYYILNARVPGERQ